MQRREHVGQPQRVFDVHHDAAQLLGEPGGQRQRFLDQLLDAPDVRVDFDRPLDDLRQRRDLRAHRRAGARDDVGADAGDAFDDDVDAAADLGHLADDADGSDAADILRTRVVLVVLLEEQQNHAVGRERAVHRLDRHRAVHRQRLQRQWKGDRSSKGKDGQFGRKSRTRWLGQSRTQFISW